MALLYPYWQWNVFVKRPSCKGRCASRKTQCSKSSKVLHAVSAFVFFMLVSGCTNTVTDSEGDSGNANPNSGTVTPAVNEPGVQSDIVANPSSSEPVQTVDNPDPSTIPVTSESVPQVDQSGIPNTNNDLAQLLLTDFVLENEQLVPTTGWICTDTIEQQRIYYFYQQGVLDANRSVTVERTLNSNNTHSDVSFFWSVSASDAIVLTTVNRDENGLLLSSGRQYDVNSIRFQEVDSVRTFVAESVLRGKLVCANFPLR